MQLTNNYIADNHGEMNMFATLFFGMLDPSNGQLAYINAGHNPPYMMGQEGTRKAALKGTGPAVGMFPGANFRIEYAQMDPGDVLLSLHRRRDRGQGHRSSVLRRETAGGASRPAVRVRDQPVGLRRKQPGRSS